MLQFLRGSLCFLVIIYGCAVLAQENQRSLYEFPIGAFLSGKPGPGVLASYDSSGLNTVVYYARRSTHTFLQKYNVIAHNTGPSDWIQYYATGYYSRWEGEQDTTIGHVGLKHKYGQRTSWQNIPCWSSIGVAAPVCSLMYGPHYRQDHRYKRLSQQWGVKYLSRFHMALSNPYSISPDNNICVIKVVYRYNAINKPGYFYPFVLHDTTFLKDTLKVSDFPPDSSFKYFDFNKKSYRYPEIFRSTITGSGGLTAADSILRYSDIDNDNGIQFCVDYLGNDSTTLFVDFAEVYDSHGWNDFVRDTALVIRRITNYLRNYSGWDNIINWYGQDEPYSLDSFTPIHIVDSILRANEGAPLMQEFQTGGYLNINGDTIMNDYMRIAKPKVLTIDPYPFGPAHENDQLRFIQEVLQKTSRLDKEFWFVAQGFGRTGTNGKWLVWRRPDSTELKAEVMLALSHGAKGLLFWNYDSYGSFKCIVDASGKPGHLWHLIHNNLAPRLNGDLGDRLLKLKYTGNFINAKYFKPNDNRSSQTTDYLTLPETPSAFVMNWHAGFFINKEHPDDKFFFLVNLLTDMDKTIPIKLTPPVPGYINYRFRHYEGLFDTTFAGTQFTFKLTHPAGEGYLYEVAPVVKYGGKLYYDESVQHQTLYSDLTIENGATLTVNGTYECYANIFIRGSGNIRTAGEGKVNFHQNARLISEDHQ